MKVKNWHFSIAEFRIYIDWFFFCEKVLFTTQLSYHLMWKLLKKFLHGIYSWVMLSGNFRKIQRNRNTSPLFNCAEFYGLNKYLLN